MLYKIHLFSVPILMSSSSSSTLLSYIKQFPLNIHFMSIDQCLLLDQGRIHPWPAQLWDSTSSSFHCSYWSCLEKFQAPVVISIQADFASPCLLFVPLIRIHVMRWSILNYNNWCEWNSHKIRNVVNTTCVHVPVIFNGFLESFIVNS